MRWIVLLLLVAAASPAGAAQIELIPGKQGTVVVIAGPIVPEDGENFARKVASLDRAIIGLESPGGVISSGLRIGQLIRERGFHTLVLDGGSCASSCGLIWLAGAKRMLQPTAKVGFHAAYIVRRGRPHESGAGNALIGAYLSRLGLPDQAVYYITSAAPQQMRWLTRRDAQSLGLEVTFLPSTPRDPQPALGRDGGEKPPEPPAMPEPARAPPAAPPPAVPLDRRAASFAGHYFATWSDTNERALAIFGRYYAPQVSFYGGPLDRAALLRRKEEFATRWPERIYAVRALSVQAQCREATQTCTVSGMVDWDSRAPARQARSIGVAKFELELDLARDPPIILSETGAVVSREADPDAGIRVKKAGAAPAPSTFEAAPR